MRQFVNHLTFFVIVIAVIPTLIIVNGTRDVVSGLRTEGQGGGVRKFKTPNVYYYPVCSGLAFRGESPAVTLGPTAQLLPRYTPSLLLRPHICGPKC